ncbi:MAG: ATP-binding protein [Candidatus Dadabacteria bacterium]|nr:MAG: ATP-binding protein [Candidatus Dadabacteria bacterium]
MTPETAIGRATATERAPNSSEQFSFWLRPGQMINPFDIVAAKQGLDDSTTYGLVTNIRHSTDAPSHLSNFIANDFGELTGDPNTPRQGTNVAEASVLSNTKDTYMPVQNESLVWFADEDGIHAGLGIDTMKRKEEERRVPICVPAGLIEMSNGTQAVAYLDAEYVLGPEGAHVNISGISGLATKTSYIMFLIQSILQTTDRCVNGGRAAVRSGDVAVVLINVKYNDLLAIDEPPINGLPPDQHALWERLGLKPQPFDNVTYLLPAGKESLRDPSRANCYAPQPDLLKTKIYAYELRDCVDKLDAMLADVPDEYGVLDAIIGIVREGIEENRQGWQNVQTWDDLINDSPLTRWASGQQQAPGAIQPRSIQRFFRYIRRFVRHRTTGIFVEHRNQSWVTVREVLSRIQGGHTYVVDIAKLHDNEQMLVFGDVVRTIYQVFAGAGERGMDLSGFDEEDYQPPKKVIIFVDELNKYAPAERGKHSPILDDILEISERGRSLGVILLSAQQFASAVHGRILGNAATKVFGRTAPTELTQPAYRFLNDDVKMHLTRLDKGDLVITHPIYRQPVKVKFPWPAYKQHR